MSSSPAVETDSASGETSSPPSEVEVARAVRDAVRGVPGVHNLAKGRFVEAATYGPLELVRGVVVHRADEAFTVEVHVVPEYSEGLLLPRLAEAVREAAREAVRPRAVTLQRVDVAVDDLWIEQSS